MGFGKRKEDGKRGEAFDIGMSCCSCKKRPCIWYPKFYSGSGLQLEKCWYRVLPALQNPHLTFAATVNDRTRFALNLTSFIYQYLPLWKSSYCPISTTLDPKTSLHNLSIMASFPNVYTHRKVADAASKACEICYKPSTSVLVTPENKVSQSLS
jgi:hypothetical protein